MYAYVVTYTYLYIYIYTYNHSRGNDDGIDANNADVVHKNSNPKHTNSLEFAFDGNTNNANSHEYR